MSLEVGKDSYVSLEEANEIIVKYYTTDSEEYTKWQGLTEGNKEVILRNSCHSIDLLKFVGRKAKYSQKLQFPRVKDAGMCGIGSRLYISQVCDNGLVQPYSNTSDGGLSLVKEAQVVNALGQAHISNNVNEANVNNLLGLTRKHIGPIDEAYGRSYNGGLSLEDTDRGIYSKKVYQILSSWLSSSVYSM